MKRYTNRDYMIYKYTRKGDMTVYVLSTKTWDKFIQFAWAWENSAEVEKTIVHKFETIGLEESSDFMHRQWLDGDVLRCLMGKRLEMLSC